MVEYTEAGAARNKPRLNTGRLSHACAKFVTNKGDTVSSFFLLWPKVCSKY